MHRLVWLPPSICDVLGGSPRCLLTISRRGRATLNFSSAKLGNDWAQCYTFIREQDVSQGVTMVA
ncbi:hypothetical protein BDV98DRAFT_576410 [Pterulicium gracile]|uniref:Uncharacterized protein n=1 Tax=Pterulicium gracile TaxID=1884261 RepID=A0A5C3Q2H0_9AGAR|nr:hypothetical protein BDV98DRAFT_576410 [Pterula gracilis]